MNGVNLHEVRVSAPGKVILHGEHSVVYGKTAIAVSLGLRTSVVIKQTQCSPKPTINFHFLSVDLNEVIELKPITEKLFNPPFLSEIPAKLRWMEPDKLDHENHLNNVEEFLKQTLSSFSRFTSIQQNALRGFLYVFSGIYGSTQLPVCDMDVLIDSELTIGAGTGSSASFAVSLAGAIVQLIKIKTGSDQGKFTLEEKKIISGWAFNCERIMHGSPSGIDNSTCTFGSLVSFRKGDEPRVLDLGLNLRVLLVDTRVSRETKLLAAKVAASRQWNGAAVDSIMEACDHVTLKATEILETISKTKHITETQVHYQRLEELWNMNHCLLAALGVSHASLEDICSTARRFGFAGKLTGAGGGGYAIVLIPPSSQQSQIDRLTEELQTKGFRVTDTRLGGEGVSLDS